MYLVWSQFPFSVVDYCSFTFKCCSQTKHISIIILYTPLSIYYFLHDCHTHTNTHQVLESNRNQLESKGVQLAANKEQLQAICLQLEGRQGEIASLNQRIAEMEQQIASSLKGLLMNSGSNGPSSPTSTTSSSSSSKVSFLKGGL